MSFCQRIAWLFHFKMCHHTPLIVKYSRRWTNFPSVQSKFVKSRVKGRGSLTQPSPMKSQAVLSSPIHTHQSIFLTTYQILVGIALTLVWWEKINNSDLLPTTRPPSPCFAHLLADCNHSPDYSTFVSYNFSIFRPISLKIYTSF